MMRLRALVVCVVVAFGCSGCGVSQKQLRSMNDLLEKSKKADCETIRYYLGVLQDEIQKKMR